MLPLKHSFYSTYTYTALDVYVKMATLYVQCTLYKGKILGKKIDFSTGYALFWSLILQPAPSPKNIE